MKNFDRNVSDFRRSAKYESNQYALAQYGRRNNVVLTGIPDSVS